MGVLWLALPLMQGFTPTGAGPLFSMARLSRFREKYEKKHSNIFNSCDRYGNRS
jgi:hypothetical protein